ncbi:hypothetical protein UY3_09604 [Chelonia mydas]|uniref:Uncharacterized protein n=1 Tax=Chelonia mydas TaxID=8469 RepID=M7B814_CHEMY|nr:hypothetical protein UY3_09604 [Chelonia mydas]
MRGVEHSGAGEGLILHLQLLSISSDNRELAKAVVLKVRPSESKMALSTPVSGLSLPWLVLLLLEIPGQSLFSSPALWIGLFLEKMLIAAFLLFLFLRSKE